MRAVVFDRYGPPEVLRVEGVTKRFGETTAVDLEEPDFLALAEAYRVPAERTTPEDLGAALERAFVHDGPALVHLPAHLRMWTPTA